ncbi:ammosamide/lymphostin RiPP family protein [Halalkalibacterium halodurans]|uniref:BH2035 protein n=1 Tax=Halalkalibacterium halodurans (strain ATCC BAA-125 / DSM 18197 / FERM 7344 / JCM 9153 / C-125) TaxID=272558 RepID=Q9KB93_HALH5|nr:ammosamide/lymphostin RiPP family protein [Halalkalibacterium halodurans]MDY7222588.1 ammosamide/lymphostin RiPP family protein [Halalkalibacterium halodurans]MDY7241809.1 ammosamide/lymphostin RiPP family protein [Halalkalibacterium halodurans]MED4080829.1 ammosamide/lymphostin RiPP family protein [Halalkalibacterium halodurans]MED4086073.1 ammosamide/lymphostin RiPP family protein [Halalkalibacterium halodurans]MED4106770.1 ammosamide/lymphostin RiPP family protein [Halalkalibacterium hal
MADKVTPEEELDLELEIEDLDDIDFDLEEIEDKVAPLAL